MARVPVSSFSSIGKGLLVVKDVVSQLRSLRSGSAATKNKDHLMTSSGSVIARRLEAHWHGSTGKGGGLNGRGSI